MDKDKIWCETSVLNTGNKVKLQNGLSREDRVGGGISIIHKDWIKCSFTEANINESFEYAVWQIDVNNKLLLIFAVYRPPGKTSINKFHDDFLDTIYRYRIAKTNLIILGDFNLHVNDPNKEDVSQFMNSMEALGLIQAIQYPTHGSGNI